jgi:hypothetical protein
MSDCFRLKFLEQNFDSSLWPWVLQEKKSKNFIFYSKFENMIDKQDEANSISVVIAVSFRY